MTTPGEPRVIARHVHQVRERIARAARAVGRDPETVRLIVATKGVAVEHIEQAIRAGEQWIGENRLQEALPKIAALGPRYQGLVWHFIGRLQRRKVRSVVGAFEVIHSLDSLELAEEIERRASAAGARQRVLLEVNLGRESSKGGFAPKGLRDVVPALELMPSLHVQGLMVVPPYSPDPEAARPYFRELRGLAQSLRQLPLKRACMDELSMGMSQDYEIAVEEGATMVRVGTAIFGARDG